MSSEGEKNLSMNEPPSKIKKLNPEGDMPPWLSEIEKSEETDGALHIDTDELVIESEVERFLTLFEKIFVKETNNTDSEDGPARDILNKIILRIKEQTDSTFAKKETAAKIIKLIFTIAEIINNSDGEN